MSDAFRGNESGDIRKLYEARLGLLARKRGGDTLYCCWDVESIWGYDRHGRGAIAYVIAGEVYACNNNASESD